MNQIINFDWQNMLIVDGIVYALTDKDTQLIFNPDAHPCNLCEMHDDCLQELVCKCIPLHPQEGQYLTRVGRLLIKTQVGDLKLEIDEEYTPI